MRNSDIPVFQIEINGTPIQWHRLDESASTMDIAADLINKGCGPWTLVTADLQSSGRGTHGRNWISPVGKGLYVSLVIPPPPSAILLENLSLLTAGVLVETLKTYFELPFEIKPPNDILIKGRKVAGIMYESVTNGKEIISLILGLGLNLSHSDLDFIKAGLPEATSLQIEYGSIPEKEDILKAFISRFIIMYENIKKLEIPHKVN